jgi:aconitate hydratase
MTTNGFHAAARARLETSQGPLTYYRLGYLEEAGVAKLDQLPFSIRILLENVLRHADGDLVMEDDLANLLKWSPSSTPPREFPFMPERVLLQDLTGVPAVVDLAAMRSAMVRMGGDPSKINPMVPADLVIDHSVQVDYFGSATALEQNVVREFERNQERYTLLRWAQNAFQNFRVVPPGAGIVHQVNLEYLASVVATREGVAFPDSVVGTDSHTTMVNGLSVLGWGVGGIEAEAVLLNQPYYMLAPEVVGVRLTGALREGVTATDLVLTIVEMLRAKGVVEKFVEFFGSGLSSLPLPDRATIANMAPEYGATVGFFPIDEETLRYLNLTGREPAMVERVERYAKAQGLFRTDDTPDPQYTETLELDLGSSIPSLAGPRRPQDRVPLDQAKRSFQVALGDLYKKPVPTPNADTAVSIEVEGQQVKVDHGMVAIAAITSCTNTSNPYVMVGAGLLAKNAVARGLSKKPWVKTSMAPGSQVVTDYLNAAGVAPSLESLGFHTVGYGCTTCIGNSGPLPETVAEAIEAHDLTAVAVLSGNRNFEGRIHTQVKANYLASPMLVVAYALAGRMDLDLTTEPLGQDRIGQPVYLSDIWPSQEEVNRAVTDSLNPQMFTNRYSQISTGSEEWQSLPVPQGELYDWDERSTYIREMPFFLNMAPEASPIADIHGARVLALLGDSVTTDHISPASAFSPKSPAGQYLVELGVEPRDLNTYGARRGNHEVMVRGTFGNPRLKNGIAPDVEGDWTLHLPSGEQMRIYDASMRYQEEEVPLLLITGKEYGSGSSRDWAAKGPSLLGVKAVLAESFERIHRSNLVGMGLLPLQFKTGENAKTLGLTGREIFDISGIAGNLQPGQEAQITARDEAGKEVSFQAVVRIDTLVEVDYYRQGGVLQTVLRRLLK